MAISITKINPLLVLILLLVSASAFADNWRASIRSALQLDNRFSHRSELSADSLLTYAYDNVESDLHSRVNFLVRGGEYFYQRGQALYELSIEKGLSEYHSRIKAGRLERSDNLGFYFLDGLELTYTPVDKNSSIKLYLGKPGRIDDVRSIQGDYLWGMEFFSQHKNNWQSENLPLKLDLLDVRLGLQKLKNEGISHRLNLGLNSEGQLSSCEKACTRFKAQFLLTYQFETEQLEDFLIDLRVPINKALRLRFSYEYYRPEVVLNPSFRDQFFSYYTLGRQKLLRGNVDYRLNSRISTFVESIVSQREIGDSGLGFHAGLKINQVLGKNYDMDLSLAADTVKFAKDSLSSLYLSLQQQFNSRLNLRLDGIIRREEKYRFGQNRVLGLDAKLNYMVKNNLIFSIEAKLINNSRLRDEHLLRLGMTYYFDNFKAKRVSHSYNAFARNIPHAES